MMKQPAYTLTCEDFLDDNVHEAKLQQTDIELKGYLGEEEYWYGKVFSGPNMSNK